MPELFYSRVRKMKICSIVQLVSLVIGAMSTAVLIEGIFSGAAVLLCAVFFFVLCICGCLIFVCIRQTDGHGKKYPPYDVPINAAELQEILKAMNAVNIGENTYVSFLSSQKISIRLLIQYQSCFDAKALSASRKKANTKINKQYGISSAVSMEKALSRLRINLLVCDSVGENVILWVSQNTSTMLSRNEAIVSVAISLQERKMYFPACMANLTLIQAKKYEVAASILSHSLGKTR